MKVLRKGWKDPEWEATVECDVCGTAFEVTRSDLTKWKVGDMRHSTFELHVRCPECKSDICLSSEDAKGHEDIQCSRDQRLGAGL